MKKGYAFLLMTMLLFTGGISLKAEETTLAERFQILINNSLTALQTAENYTLGTSDIAEAWISNALQSDDGNGYAGLLDDDSTTYFHSNWEGGPSEAHYIQAILNTDTKAFIFKFWSRHNDANARPTEMTISVSNDSTNFTTIKTMTTELTNWWNTYPDKGAPALTSKLVYLNGSAYKYIRFTVTKTTKNGTSNGQVYFNCGGLHIYNADIATGAAILSHPTEVVALQEAVTNAQAITDPSDSDYDTLLVAVNAFISATGISITIPEEDKYEDIDGINWSDLLSDAESSLNTAYAYTTTSESLITNSSSQWTSNAAQNDTYQSDGGGYDVITDSITGVDNTSNYWTSNWLTAISEDHYLQAKIDSGTEAFIFKWYPRVTANGISTAYPVNMTITASPDNSTYYQIMNINYGWPSVKDTFTYVSPLVYLGVDTAYQYVRFIVTKTFGEGTNNAHYYFDLSELNLIKTNVTGTIVKNNPGAVRALEEAVIKAKSLTSVGKSDIRALNNALKAFRTATAIETISAGEKDNKLNVYSIDGRIIRANVDIDKAVENLNKGLYIIGNKKIVVK